MRGSARRTLVDTSIYLGLRHVHASGHDGLASCFFRHNVDNGMLSSFAGERCGSHLLSSYDRRALHVDCDQFGDRLQTVEMHPLVSMRGV